MLGAGLTGLLIGWYLHGVFYPAGTPTPQPRGQNAIAQEPHHLERYHVKPSPQSRPQVTNPHQASFANELRDLLDKRRYTDAMARFNERQQALSKTEFNRARQLFLQHARELYRFKSYDDALGLINGYLETEYRDVAALRLKAEILSRQQTYRDQIETLYAAKSYAYEPEELERITNAIRNGVADYQRLLQQKSRYPELLDLYQRLVYLEPDYSPYFIQLAKAQRANNLDQEARQSLELVLSDPAVGEQARQLLNDSRATDDSQPQNIAQIDQLQGIPLQRRGSHFVVEATLNGYTPLRLIIDTGASLTIIKTDALRASLADDLSRYPTHMFNTANGYVQAPVLNVDSLAIGEFQVTNLAVGGLDLQGQSDVDGLLGMNFLEHYRFFIDQQNNLLRLALNSR
jgi:clan AA aspartic protease (TIGR02281 family)